MKSTIPTKIHFGKDNIIMSNLNPVKLSPAFKDYLWGGVRLKSEFNKQCHNKNQNFP